MKKLLLFLLLFVSTAAQAGTTIQFTTAERNAMLDTFRTDAGSGAVLRIYSGTKPATADTVLSGNTLLCEMTISGTFATGAASGGSITLNTISNDTSNDASGTASFWRILKASGPTVVAQGDVSTAGASVNLNGLAITIAGQCASTGGTISIAP